MNRILIHYKINGEHLELMVDPNQRALDVLRDQLRLTGTKEGCGVGECGACTILCGGLAVNSCLMPAVQMDREDIWTAEGLAQLEIGQQLQRAFSENGAVQCGFCTPGMLMSAYALLLKNPKPDEEKIRTALAALDMILSSKQSNVSVHGEKMKEPHFLNRGSKYEQILGIYPICCSRFGPKYL